MRILLLERELSDVEMFRRAIGSLNGQLGPRELQVIESVPQCDQLLHESDTYFHALFCDLNLPQSDWMDTLQYLKKIRSKLPIIVFTSSYKEELMKTIGHLSIGYLIKGSYGTEDVICELRRAEGSCAKLQQREQLLDDSIRVFSATT